MYIKKAARRLAKEDGVSLNQWICVAVAEKNRSRGNCRGVPAQARGLQRSKLLTFLKKAPVNQPEEDDRVR